MDDSLKTAYSRHILTDSTYELTDAKSIPQTYTGPKQTQAPLLAKKLIAVNTCWEREKSVFFNEVALAMSIYSRPCAQD